MWTLLLFLLLLLNDIMKFVKGDSGEYGVFFKKPGDTLQEVLPRIDPNSQLTWRRPEEKEESLVVTLVDNQVTCVGQFEDRCELNSSTSELRLLNLTAADTGHLLLRNSSDEVVWTGYVSVEGVVLMQGETLRHTLKNTVHLLRLCLRSPGTKTDVLVMTVDHNTSHCTGRFTDRCGYNSSTAEFWLNDLTVSDTGLYIARNLDKEVVWACNVDVKSNAHSPQNILPFQVLVIIIGIIAVCFLCILLYKAQMTKKRTKNVKKTYNLGDPEEDLKVCLECMPQCSWIHLPY